MLAIPDTIQPLVWTPSQIHGDWSQPSQCHDSSVFWTPAMCQRCAKGLIQGPMYHSGGPSLLELRGLEAQAPSVSLVLGEQGSQVALKSRLGAWIPGTKCQGVWAQGNSSAHILPFATEGAEESSESLKEVPGPSLWVSNMWDPTFLSLSHLCTSTCGPILCASGHSADLGVHSFMPHTFTEAL